MHFLTPKIESEGYNGPLVVTVYDCDAPGYRRNATPEEVQQAILYWIAEIHSRIGQGN